MTEPAADANENDPAVIALSIAGSLAVMGPGEKAALRRLTDEAAAPAYWRLAARHDALARRDRWVPIVRALAILTPKGTREERGPDLHDATRKLGTALCDGGDAGWPGTLAPGAKLRPMLSEQRLAQLLAARGPQRTVLLTRAVRALAARRDAGLGADVRDLAWAFLNTDPAPIAGPYYRRLDRAERTATQTKMET